MYQALRTEGIAGVIRVTKTRTEEAPLKPAQRSHEIEMMMLQVAHYGHTVENDSSYLCLSIDRKHMHQASSQDMHAYLSGYLAACEQYEWRDASKGRLVCNTDESTSAHGDECYDKRYIKDGLDEQGR